MDFAELVRLVTEGDAGEAEAWTRRALQNGAEPGEILERGLITAMDGVGRLYSAGEIYVPEMLVAARAMKTCLTVLQPLLAQGDHASRGKVVIGTVKGDIHDIGKNIVGIMLEGSGFEVVDLGVDVSPQAFAEAVVEHRPDIVGLSALLTTTMPVMRTVISALEEFGVRETVKVMVGGAPLTDEYAREIGADAYASDAARASERAKELVSAV